MSSSPKKILIVEDELVLQLMLIHMLQRMGFEQFEKTTKGREAVRLCEDNDFGFILMDIMLQDDIDGIEAYRQIKEKKGDIPVIYITGNTDPKNKERAEELGYYDYLGKPLTFKQLKSSIDKIEPLKP
ncbi:MAG TPA: response regulator [Balneolaceae bacterium]|nr:response regulator [Balneolaceae bacterium]